MRHQKLKLLIKRLLNNLSYPLLNHSLLSLQVVKIVLLWVHETQWPNQAQQWAPDMSQQG